MTLVCPISPRTGSHDAPRFADESLPVHGPRVGYGNWAVLLPRQILRPNDWPVRQRRPCRIRWRWELLSLRQQQPSWIGRSVGA